LISTFLLEFDVIIMVVMMLISALC
jgi:hypothetical protein